MSRKPPQLVPWLPIQTAPCEKCGEKHVTGLGTAPPCMGHKKDGSSCRMPSLRGGSYCTVHGGQFPNVKKAAAKRVATVKAEVVMQEAITTFGLRRDITPMEALLEEVSRTAANVEWLEHKVREIAQEDEEKLVWGLTKIEDIEAAKDRGTNTTEEARVNIWYELLTRERDHLVKVSSAAIKAGVSEIQVRLAEDQATKIAAAIQRLIDDLDLSKKQLERVPTIVPQVLRFIDAGGTAA
jgi:hypothetical protein